MSRDYSIVYESSFFTKKNRSEDTKNTKQASELISRAHTSIHAEMLLPTAISVGSTGASVPQWEEL